MSKVMVVMATLGVIAFLAFAISSRAETVAGKVPTPDAPSALSSVISFQYGGESGTMAALHRIWRSARTACGERPAPMELADGAQYRKCMSEEVESGLAALRDRPVMADDTADCKLPTSVARR
jgi:hypothetical protein